MTVTFTGTATDPLAQSLSVATNVKVVATGSAVAPRVVQRAMIKNRINWSDSIKEAPVAGPSFGNFGAITVAQKFKIQEFACTLVSANIYKPPAANGTITVTAWDVGGTVLGSQTATWIADNGGWRNIVFPLPISLAQGSVYQVGWYSPSGDVASTNWVYHAQPWSNPPFFIAQDTGSVYITTPATPTTAPNTADTQSSNYYVDPVVQWTDTRPAYVPGGSYFTQWTDPTPYSRFAFPVAIFFADPGDIAAYAAAGINTLLSGPARSDYQAAIVASGMDHWPQDVPGNVVDTGAYESQVRGYYIIDEPDLVPGPGSAYQSPTIVQGKINSIRATDATKPVMLGLSNIIGINGVFYGLPAGVPPPVPNEDWRAFANTVDVLSGDFYQLTPAENNGGLYGVWGYATYVNRLREVADDRVPIWTAIETIDTGGFGITTPPNPTPALVRRATWAALIAGARGIVYFDHYFGPSGQDDAWMLHDPQGGPMLAMVTALAAQMQTLGPALLAPDAGLVSATVTSNLTAGPMGGTFGVPLHYTTRTPAGSTKYLFAMGIRPGATTGTFTIPSAPSKTLTVIGESRTVVTNGSGVFSDSFAADYDVHLYSWT